MFEKDKFIYLDPSMEILISCIDFTIENFIIDKKSPIKVIKENAFKDCFLLKNVTIDKKDLYIEKKAFPDDTIKTLTIGDGLIDKNAINVKQLQKITFLKGVVNQKLFLDFPTPRSKARNLEEINVIPNDKEETDFSVDGVWYKKNEDNPLPTLMFYPPGKKDKFFEVIKVKNINDIAFRSNPYLETIALPKIYYMEEFYTSFISCKNLKQILIPVISHEVFLEKYDCPNLTTIYTDCVHSVNDYMKEEYEIAPSHYFREESIKKAKSFKEINKVYKSFR